MLKFYAPVEERFKIFIHTKIILLSLFKFKKFISDEKK